MAMQRTWMLRAHWDDERGDDRELEVIVDLGNQEADVRCSKTKRILLRKVRTNLKPVDLLPGKRMAIGPCGMARVIDVASDRTKEYMEQMAETAHLMIKTTPMHGMSEIIEQLVKQDLELASIWNVGTKASSIQKSSMDVETDRFHLNESDAFHVEEADHLAMAAGNSPCAPTASFEGTLMQNEKIGDVLVSPGARESEEDMACSCFDHGNPGTKLWVVETVGPCAKAVGQSMARKDYVAHITPFPGCENMLNCANSTTAQEIEANFGSQSCCIIKPHAMCKAGSIVRILEARFEVVNLKVVTWCAKEADTFLTLYRGCVPSYSEHVRQMSSGRFLAVHVAGHRAFEGLRALCGARDPSIAQILDPTSLRARFGTDRVRNAVHCTDLLEECSFELNYIFGGFRCHEMTNNDYTWTDGGSTSHI